MTLSLERLANVYKAYPIYFITCCMEDRQPLPANAEIHAAFRRFGELAKLREILIGRYVIMPDHLHFFVTLSDGINLSMWIKTMKNSLSKTLRETGYLLHIGRKASLITW